jgi:hypothetical protein
MSIPTSDVQRQRLWHITQDAAGYGVLIYVDRPGDVSAVVPVHPDLAGYEICCVTGDDEYDIWKDGDLHLPNQTRNQIATWLSEHPVPDDRAAEYTEATMIRLGIPKVADRE